MIHQYSAGGRAKARPCIVCHCVGVTTQASLCVSPLAKASGFRRANPPEGGYCTLHTACLSGLVLTGAGRFNVWRLSMGHVPESLPFCSRPCRCQRQQATCLGRLHPLTAPAVKPATMRFWKNNTSTTSGIVTTIAAAIISAIGS